MIPPTPAARDDNRNSRFVGDTNPEGLLVEVVCPKSRRDSSHSGGVGIWICQPVTVSHAPAVTLAHRGLESIILPYVRDICFKVVPPAPDLAALRTIYLNKIHPLFPIFGDMSLRGVDQSPETTLAKQVICLAAATDPSAGPHLQFESGSRPLSHAEFSTTLTSAIRATVDSGLIKDHLVLSRCLSLLSLYIQPPSAEDADLPSLIASLAVHHAHTLAVEIKGKSESEDREMERLFLCVWTLDRLNAAFHGRSCLMHERDFGRSLGDSIARQPPEFRLVLAVVMLLDKVIALYRPGAENCDFFDSGALEEIIVRAGATRINPSLLATIETFYHAVNILSCRLPSPGREGRGMVPVPAADCRRSLAAERITFVVGTEFEGRLSPFPIVPYAVSLSLSVQYRKMRHTRVPVHWNRAKRLFARNCKLLERMGEGFWSARMLAGLGERVLREMERVVRAVGEQGGGEGTANGNGNGNGSGHGHGNGLGSGGDEVRQDRQDEVGRENGEEVVIAGVNTSVEVEAAAMAGGGGAAGLWDTSLNREAFPDVDLFGHWDPGFNVDAVDAALEANLDLGLQVHWPDCWS